MNDSCMLLFVIPQAESNHLIITGKLFEYLAVRSPILAVGPVKGDASKILHEAGRDPMQDYPNKNAIKEIIKKYYKKWMEENRYSHKHDNSTKQDFSRLTMTRKFSKFLKEVM
jgi:hypothetical protein